MKRFDLAARDELRKFFQVAVIFLKKTGKVAGMAKCYVDSYWHKLIENKAEYAEFCRDAIGCHVVHLEAKGDMGWISIYEKHFGPLPPVWFTDLEGVIESEKYARYIKGSIPALDSWQCTPGILPSKPKPPLDSWNCTPLLPVKKPEPVRERRAPYVDPVRPLLK